MRERQEGDDALREVDIEEVEVQAGLNDTGDDSDGVNRALGEISSKEKGERIVSSDRAGEGGSHRRRSTWRIW